MDRRRFLSSGLGLAGAAALASQADAAGQCGLVAPGVQGCTVGVNSFALEPAAQRQYASEWCWAASISMVFRYYGYDVPQQRIVAETWGGIVNMPGAPDQILNDLNRQWTDNGGRTFQSQGDVFSANLQTAVQDLSTDNPLLIGALGHCMVLSSISYLQDIYGRWQIQGATVRDPWPYNPGRRLLTPQEWFSVQFLARVRVS